MLGAEVFEDYAYNKPCWRQVEKCPSASSKRRIEDIADDQPSNINYNSFHEKHQPYTIHIRDVTYAVSIFRVKQISAQPSQ